MEKEESLRLAIAMSLLRSKIQNRLPSSSTSLCDAPSETDPLRWKQKNRRSSSSTSRGDAHPSDTDALRWKQKVVIYSQRMLLASVISLIAWENSAAAGELERPLNGASLKKLISMGRNLELVEESISSMITQLIARMCTPFKGNEVKQLETSVGFYVQHLIRKLGSDPYIGQRAIFAISQRISILAENILVMDPFDESFSEMDEIQLIEFLICDYLLTWAGNEAFETVVFEEWIPSVIHARKAVAALEERNGLYLLFMDRVTGELAKRVGQVTSFREVEPAILDKILAYPE
ncbi:hypothetical protein Bca101_011063 [Brassica carinata]